MITKEKFIETINNIVKLNKEYDRWDDFGINLWELPIGVLMSEIIDASYTWAFTEEGIDWISWWLYERESFYGGEPNKVFDENNKEIPSETVEDLWELVKEYRK